MYCVVRLLVYTLSSLSFEPQGFYSTTLGRNLLKSTQLSPHRVSQQFNGEHFRCAITRQDNRTVRFETRPVTAALGSFTTSTPLLLIQTTDLST